MGAGRPFDGATTKGLGSTARVQVLEGRISSSTLQRYRITSLRRGKRLYVHASNTSGYLDPLVALLRPDVNVEDLEGEALGKFIETLSRDHDPIAVTRDILQRYALAGNDDYEGHY